MEHDLVLMRENGSTKCFHIYAGRHRRGELVSLPIDGRLIKARIGNARGEPSLGTERIKSIDHVEAAEI